jgi:hypothetical protein
MAEPERALIRELEGYARGLRRCGGLPDDPHVMADVIQHAADVLETFIRSIEKIKLSSADQL